MVGVRWGTRVAQQPGKQQDSGQLGCGVAVLVVVLLVGASLCSKKDNPASTSNSADSLTGGQTAPPPLEPFSASAARVGFRHFRLAYAADGASGAAIYSRNCYDALEHHFSWSKLDICGAFDLEAAETLAGDETGSADISYFDAETSAGRYLGEATKAGEDATDADQRLAHLQRIVPKPKHARIAVPVTDTPTETGAASAELNAADLNAADE